MASAGALSAGASAGRLIASSSARSSAVPKPARGEAFITAAGGLRGSAFAAGGNGARALGGAASADGADVGAGAAGPCSCGGCCCREPAALNSATTSAGLASPSPFSWVGCGKFAWRPARARRNRGRRRPPHSPRARTHCRGGGWARTWRSACRSHGRSRIRPGLAPPGRPSCRTPDTARPRHQILAASFCCAAARAKEPPEEEEDSGERRASVKMINRPNTRARAFCGSRGPTSARAQAKLALSGQSRPLRA